ncbi:hypothetical protein SNEBB_008244 [Seison nebaliae]|nr:hypothetical protein SNEBB_008244 [Seison nebaliae]
MQPPTKCLFNKLKLAALDLRNNEYGSLNTLKEIQLELKEETFIAFLRTVEILIDNMKNRFFDLLPFQRKFSIQLINSTIVDDIPGAQCRRALFHDLPLQSFELRLDNTTLPPQLTTYYCQQFEIPLDLNEEYHAVAFEPLISNRVADHHMILFGCENGVPSSSITTNCFTSVAGAQCLEWTAQWSYGTTAWTCPHYNSGILLGGENGFRTFHIQLHVNNANHLKNMYDNSGWRVYYTKKLRRFNAANVQIGQDAITIPAESKQILKVEGSCSSFCVNDALESQTNIYLNRIHIHTHYLGVRAKVELIRRIDNKTSIHSTVVDDQNYDFHHPPIHNFEKPIKIERGDEIKVTCYYESFTDHRYRNRTIHWGEGSDGEMCYAFVGYYPKIHRFFQCTQYEELDNCLFSRYGVPVTGKCNFNEFLNQMSSIAKEVIEKCEKEYLYDSSAISFGCYNALVNLNSNNCLKNAEGRKIYNNYLKQDNRFKIVLKLMKRAHLRLEFLL